METCRNAARNSGREVPACEGTGAAVVHMAEVILKNIKKIYPFVPGEEKKKIQIDHILEKFNEISIECGN